MSVRNIYFIVTLCFSPSLPQIKGSILQFVPRFEQQVEKTSVEISRPKRKVPVDKEVEFYKLVNQLKPETLKILMPNMTEEPELETPSHDCCYNGGTCHMPTNRREDRWCECPSSFTGRYCDIDVNECVLANICPPHQYCKNTYGSYECRCLENFIADGPDCIRKTNCYENPCTNFADCVDQDEGRVLCLCKLGYVGPRCEIKVAECEDSSCNDDETCIATPEGPYCTKEKLIEIK